MRKDEKHSQIVPHSMNNSTLSDSAQPPGLTDQSVPTHEQTQEEAKAWVRDFLLQQRISFEKNLKKSIQRSFHK